MIDHTTAHDQRTPPSQEQGMSEGSRDTVRVSLREIREGAFRALSAIGASHGEASTAARMVLDAELHGHRGVEAVVQELGRGPWPRQGVETTDSEQDASPVRLGDTHSTRLFRDGPLAAHVAAAEPGRGGVVVPGELPGVECLDAVLLEVAAATGQTVGVIRLPVGDHSAYRVALADGALGFGVSGGGHDDASGEGVLEDLATAVPPEAGLGLWFVCPAPQHLCDSSATSWVSEQERADGRTIAARQGCLVDAGAWSVVYAASRRYLVESDTKG